MEKPDNMPLELWNNIIWENLKGIFGAIITEGDFKGWPLGVAWTYKQGTLNKL